MKCPNNGRAPEKRGQMTMMTTTRKMTKRRKPAKLPQWVMQTVTTTRRTRKRRRALAAVALTMSGVGSSWAENTVESFRSTFAVVANKDRNTVLPRKCGTPCRHRHGTSGPGWQSWRGWSGPRCDCALALPTAALLEAAMRRGKAEDMRW